MDKIAEVIGRVKGRVYEAQKALATILQTPAYPVDPADTLGALRKGLEEIEIAIEEFEAWYAEDERAATCLALATPPVSGVRQVPVRPAPQGSPESAQGLASWPGHGCAGEPSPAVQATPRRVRGCLRRANRVLAAPGGDAGECPDVAGPAS